LRFLIVAESNPFNQEKCEYLHFLGSNRRARHI